MADFSILFVCTGNICRSPTAELLLRSRLRRRLGKGAPSLALSSAGLGTPGGWELDPPVAELLALAGVKDPETGDFRSRALDADAVTGADLIFTGTRKHRLQIGTDFSDAYQRCFTMREAATLLARVGGADLPEYDLTERAQAVKSHLQQERSKRVVPNDQQDIKDPHRQSMSAYREMFGQVQEVVDVLAFVFAPGTLVEQPAR